VDFFEETVEALFVDGAGGFQHVDSTQTVAERWMNA